MRIDRKISLLFLLDPYKFTIGDTTNFGFYEDGGKVIEIRRPQIIHFVSVVCDVVFIERITHYTSTYTYIEFVD